jgi:hypothetical protein
MTRLEKVSNIAVIIVASLVTGTTLYDRLVARGPSAQTTLLQQFTGKQLPLPASLATGNKGTITLFISKNCHFCTESMSLYQRLADSRSNASCDVKIVALGPKERETREDVQTYLTEHNLTVDGMEMVNFMNLGVSSTPTLVLRDASRLVRRVWVGRLSGAKENEVLAEVKSLCHG